MMLRQDQRGASLTPFAVVIMGALLMTAGLVVDGGQKITAASRADAAAAGASRAAGNAAATRELAGADSAGAAVRAARIYLAGQPDVTGSVRVSDGIVSVTTRSTEPTIFLSLIGIDAVTGTGSAAANIVASGDDR